MTKADKLRRESNWMERKATAPLARTPELLLSAAAAYALLAHLEDELVPQSVAEQVEALEPDSLAQ
jgi:hypothetical protein